MRGYTIGAADTIGATSAITRDVHGHASLAQSGVAGTVTGRARLLNGGDKR